jgi:hypothetical protein
VIRIRSYFVHAVKPSEKNLLVYLESEFMRGSAAEARKRG